MSWLSLLLLIIPLALGCGGRVLTQWPQKQIFTEYFRQQEVKLGMSRQEVEAIMGSPQMHEEGDFGGGHFLVYFYRTHNMDYSESGTVRGGYTPFIFQNNRLVGKGSRAYFRAVDRASWSEEVTPPSRAPNRSIYQQRSW
jgi:outer membrane protein assembly factor BamE (lipoprotein component of BamABCDE complex)